MRSSVGGHRVELPRRGEQGPPSRTPRSRRRAPRSCCLQIPAELLRSLDTSAARSASPTAPPAPRPPSLPCRISETRQPLLRFMLLLPCSCGRPPEVLVRGLALARSPAGGGVGGEDLPCASLAGADPRGARSGGDALGREGAGEECRHLGREGAWEVAALERDGGGRWLAVGRVR